MNNIKITISAFFAIITFATSQTKKTTAPSLVKPAATKPKIVTKSYSSVTIGGQVWMDKNLDVSTFRNGDPIARAQSFEEWRKAIREKKPAWCYYHVGYSKLKKHGNPESGKYGKLYNYYAITDPRGLAPKGWKVPEYDDWQALMNFVGDKVLGKDVDLKSKEGWGYGFEGTKGNEHIFPDMNGTNSTGFNALPGGYRGAYSNGSDFDRIGTECYFWINNSHPEDNSLGFHTTFIRDSNINSITYDWCLSKTQLYSGHSVRCVKETAKSPVPQE